MQARPKLSIVLLSPELPKLQAGSLMASVAAASGMEVNVFVSMGALGQFRRQVVERREFAAAQDEVSQALLKSGAPLFPELLRQGKELGELHVFACAMAADLMGWSRDEFVDVVEDVIGVAAFFGRSEGATILTL
ncbi:MAG TPA: DsrE/DsrF/DrsH-like family protein [Limnochordales bacterium]